MIDCGVELGEGICAYHHHAKGSNTLGKLVDLFNAVLRFSSNGFSALEKLVCSLKLRLRVQTYGFVIDKPEVLSKDWPTRNPWTPLQPLAFLHHDPSVLHMYTGTRTYLFKVVALSSGNLPTKTLTGNLSDLQVETDRRLGLTDTSQPISGPSQDLLESISVFDGVRRKGEYLR